LPLEKACVLVVRLNTQASVSVGQWCMLLGSKTRVEFTKHIKINGPATVGPMENEMKKAIDKLILEYEQKISQEEILLDSIKKKNTIARHNEDIEAMGVYREEMRVSSSRQQAYIQAKADIDSLLDYLDNL
jgi:hypothetical protein